MRIEGIWYVSWVPEFWWPVHNALNWIYIRLVWLTESIEGVPFLGEYLVIPFRWITLLVLDILNGLGGLARSWEHTWEFIHGLVDGDILDTLVRGLSFNWPNLITRLNTWIWEPVESLLETWIKWYVNLRELIYDAIDPIAPWFRVFIDSPYDWLLGLLEEAFDPLYRFYLDPIGFVTDEIYRLFPVTQYIFDDPVDWLKDRLSDLFGVERAFWDDPLESLKQSIQLKLVDMIEEGKDDLYSVGEHLFRYFLEGVW